MTERRVRIAVLTSVHPPFDTRIYHRQAKSTAAAGFDVVLFAPGAPRGRREGVRMRPLPSWGGRWARPFRWPSVFFGALRSRADIYHLHDPELLPWGLLLHWVTGRPVIYDSHEYLREDILGKHWIPAVLRRPVAAAAERVEKWIAGRLTAVVTVTDDMAGRFRRVQPRTITVRNLPPAPDLPDPPEPRAPVVVHAGLMNMERGLDILYKTARLVHGLVRDAEFHLLGTVEWHGLPEDEARTQEEWAAVGVRFLGTVPQPEVAPILARASVGWLPRSPAYQNNLLAWPNKLVEYMVCGLPVVASDLPIQAQVINDAGCGFAVEALSATDHATAIVKLLLDTPVAREMGERGRRVGLEQYSWAGEALKLHTIYRDLAALR